MARSRVLTPIPVAAAAAPSRVSFVAGSSASILVHGAYPRVSSPCVRKTQPLLHARYGGTIEIGKDDQGKLFVIGVTSLETYLKGLAEVPRTWPMEALKAQVVAARSYALAHMAYPDPVGDKLGYQICATDACQVYLGLGIADGPYGERWRQAVNTTRDQVLLYNGRPADALYFSTSNGRTYSNSVVFGTDPLPYLRQVTEKDDGASPVSRWTASIRFSDVGRFLRTAGDWGSGAVTSVKNSGDNVVVSGSGESRTLSRSDFRSDMNSWAHCLDPDRYPGSGLPQTVPSKWFSSSVSSGSAVLTGRGWGHGVGMVQWGADGKASQGMSYADILAFYYGGLRPQKYPGPGQIRVGIAVGLTSVRIQTTGPVTLEGSTVSATPDQTSWLVTGGKRLRVKPADHPPPAYVTAGTLKGPAKGKSGHELSATLTLPQLSVASLVLDDAETGTEVQVSKPSTELAGETTLTGTVPEIPTGTYQLRAVVTNGIDIVRTKGRRIHITGLPPTPSPSPTPSTPVPTPSRTVLATAPASRGLPLPVVVGIAATPVVIGAALALLRRRRGRRPPVSSGFE
jgi:stage II sporulation protein D